MYRGVDDSEGLMHHKYLRRYMKGGKWRYVYQSNKPKVTKGGFDVVTTDGRRNNQKWTDVETKNGTHIGTISGNNSIDRYAGVSVGKIKDDYNYKERSVKVGGVEAIYDNDYGMHNVTIHVDNEKLEKGKSRVEQLLKKIKSKK